MGFSSLSSAHAWSGRVFRAESKGARSPPGPAPPVAVAPADVEVFLPFARFNKEGKRDFLLNRRRRQGEGRYALKRAARLLAAGAGERYEALLSQVVSAVEKGEAPCAMEEKLEKKLVSGTSTSESTGMI